MNVLKIQSHDRKVQSRRYLLAQAEKKTI